MKVINSVLLGLMLFAAGEFACGLQRVYAQDEKPAEYEVKAAFIYNFVKFVEWPEMQNAASFVIAVCGNDPFGPHLDSLQKKNIRGKRLETRRVNRSQELKACNVLFISASEIPHLGQIIEGLKGSPVLTVGDSEGLAQKGVIINFWMEENRVRFEVNVEAAKRAGLKISSSLLKLARIVRE